MINSLPLGFGHARCPSFLRDAPLGHQQFFVDVPDGTIIVYFNQQESWTSLTCPGDGLNGQVKLSWQTLGEGTRIAFDADGTWAFLRLLATAQVNAVDRHCYELAWPQPGAEVLRFVMRTHSDGSPLAVLLLRDFKMSQQIFLVDDASGGKGTSNRNQL